MASHKDTKVDCSKVYVKTSSFATKDNQFDGAFAAVPIKEGKRCFCMATPGVIEDIDTV